MLCCNSHIFGMQQKREVSQGATNTCLEMWRIMLILEEYQCPFKT